MEINNCEQYVVMKLLALEDEYEEMVDKLAEKAEEIKSLRDTLAWSGKDRERLTIENDELKERVRNLEATCSEFARKLDRAKRGLPLEVDDGDE